jgi:hypothetical protein
MIAIDGGTVPRATKNQINRIGLGGLGQGRSDADEKLDRPLYGKCDRRLCGPNCFDIAEA